MKFLLIATIATSLSACGDNIVPESLLCVGVLECDGGFATWPELICLTPEEEARREYEFMSFCGDAVHRQLACEESACWYTCEAFPARSCDQQSTGSGQ